MSVDLRLGPQAQPQPIGFKFEQPHRRVRPCPARHRRRHARPAVPKVKSRLLEAKGSSPPSRNFCSMPDLPAHANSSNPATSRSKPSRATAGLGTPADFRNLFKAHAGVPPSVCRETFVG